MNPRVLLGVSIILNVALAGATIYYASRRSQEQGASGVPAPTAHVTEVPAPAESVATFVAVTNQSGQSFGWRMVESEDYRKYIANLRAIGCPEETIRDIIVADVNKLYDQRRRELTTSTNKFEFWKSGSALQMGQAFDPERIEKLQALNKEKRALLKELLGVDYEEKAEFMAGMNPLESMFDFLPAGKQNQIMDVYMKYQAKQMKAMDGGTTTPEDMKQINAIQKEMEAEMAGIMSPQEYEQYQLRMSTTAMMMRTQLGSFDPNEQEFRDIFKLRKQFDDDQGSLFGMAGKTKEERENMMAAQKDLNAQIKGVLGDTRYAEYERAQDYSYQQLYKITERNGVSKDNAVKAYDMQKLAQAKMAEIRGNKDMPQDQRNAALQAIANETEKALQTVLGDPAWKSYKDQPAAYWLQNIRAQGSAGTINR